MVTRALWCVRARALVWLVRSPAGSSVEAPESNVKR